MNVFISDTPHIRRKRTTKTIMLDVLIALIPATVAGLVYFGFRAAVTLVIAIVSSLFTEVVWRLVKKENIKTIFKSFDFKQSSMISLSTFPDPITKIFKTLLLNSYCATILS